MQGLLGSRGSDRRMQGLGGTVANPGFTRGRESSLPGRQQEDGPFPRPRGWGPEASPAFGDLKSPPGHSPGERILIRSFLWFTEMVPAQLSPPTDPESGPSP